MLTTTDCKICGSRDLSVFLKRRGVPIHQNLLYRDQQSAVDAPRGDLQLAICKGCGFVCNLAFNAHKVLYGSKYDNTQHISPAFQAHLESLRAYLTENRGVRNCRILEVGCGDGYFLKSLVSDEILGNVGYGFDPSYRGPDSEFGGRLLFKRDYYGPDFAYIRPDIVILRHVIEHIADPMDLLLTIKAAFSGPGSLRVFFETPDVEWILRNSVIWDFFYEHCSYFSEESLSRALVALGFRVDEVRKVFGGQYLWAEATLTTSRESIIVEAKAKELFGLAMDFARDEALLIETWTQKVNRLALAGGVAIWGAGAKGVTLANLIDSECRIVTCVVDLNLNKQGGYIPGTGHPIVGYLDLPRLAVRSAVLVNPEYHRENLILLKGAGIEIQIEV